MDTVRAASRPGQAPDCQAPLWSDILQAAATARVSPGRWIEALLDRIENSR